MMMSLTMRLAQPRVNGYQGFTSQTDALSLHFEHFDGFANESGAAWPVLWFSCPFYVICI